MPDRSADSDRIAAEKAIGRPLEELVTPALVLDIDKADQNIAAMSRWLADKRAALRPHIKVHKVPQLALRQVAAGAVGVACATVWEARAMVEAGIADVMIVNEVIGTAKTAVLIELAGRARLSTLVDNPEVAVALAGAAQRAGLELGLLVDLDVGMHRCGVRTVDEAVTLARAIDALPGLEFRGVMGYEGHCMNEPDLTRRLELLHQVSDKVTTTIGALADAGLPCQIVAGGGTGTFDVTGANPVMTELHAGSYAVMDTSHQALAPGSFQVAMHVYATVISRYGVDAVVDSGRKAVSPDAAMPAVDVDGDTIVTRFIAEEHLGLRLPVDSPLRIGDRVRVIAGYAPTTVNLHGVMYVASAGTVTDVWPIRARHGTADAI
jgi:D-serine deaminase-like pyridoxal phosphate-dependent protein